MAVLRLADHVKCEKTMRVTIRGIFLGLPSRCRRHAFVLRLRHREHGRGLRP